MSLAVHSLSRVPGPLYHHSVLRVQGLPVLGALLPPRALHYRRLKVVNAGQTKLECVTSCTFLSLLPYHILQFVYLIFINETVCEFNSIVGVLVCMCEKLCCSYVIWAIVRVYLLNTFLTGFCAGACLLS